MRSIAIVVGLAATFVGYFILTHSPDTAKDKIGVAFTAFGLLLCFIFSWFPA